MPEGKPPNRKSRASRPLLAMGSLAAASLKPLRDGATEAVLDSAWFEGLLADALDSDRVQAGLKKALESEGAESVVAKLFESGLVDEFVDRLVTEGALWELIAQALNSEGSDRLITNGALWRLVEVALESEGAGRLVTDDALWQLIERSLESAGASRLINNPAFWQLIGRALESDGAATLVESDGLWRLIDKALQSKGAEELVARVLSSPAMIRAIERAIESHAASAELSSDEIARVTKRVLESDTANHVWSEVLESAQAQMLVERIAGAPEIREAVAAQSAGLITDIGVRLTIITEGLDDGLERIVRPRDSHSETDQAGLATRAAAATIDLGLLFAGYSLVSSVLASLVSTVFGGPLSLASAIVLCTLGVIAGGAIFAVFWALAGQTPGMRFLAIRLIYHGSREITFGCAIRRVLAVIVSLLPLGLGYLAILRDPQRRAWTDRMTGTKVIYDSVARAAPHAGGAPTSAAAARHRSRRRENPAGDQRHRDPRP